MSDPDAPSARPRSWVGSFGRDRAVAFLWGMGEATLFFIVPDVCLTWFAVKNLKRAFVCSLVALAGAVIGGMIMYGAGKMYPAETFRILRAIPGIHTDTIAAVADSVDADGIRAVFAGPLCGIPYKIYAAQWGAIGGGFWMFVLLSFPARFIRFGLSVAAAGAVTSLLRRCGVDSAKWGPRAVALFWTVFYLFYFRAVGW